MSSADGRPAPLHTPFVVRHRIWLSWIAALSFLTLIATSRAALRENLFHEIMEQVGFILIGIATLGRIWCGVYIAGRKNKDLCQDGPYSLCRNPLYVFSFFGAVGIAMGAKAIFVALIVGPIFWLYYCFVIRSEEGVLRQRFGAAFEDYCRRVPMIVPRFSGFWTRPEMTIEPGKVTAAIVEASWFLWFIVILEMLEVIKTSMYHADRAILFRLPF